MTLPTPRYLLDLGDGQPAIECRDAHPALLLARLWVAHETGRPAIESPAPGRPALVLGEDPAPLRCPQGARRLRQRVDEELDVHPAHRQ